MVTKSAFVLQSLATLLLGSSSALANPFLLGTFFGQPNTNATYDYVVVGGGTSGLTVAKRLAETKGVTVGVIEAGSFYELDNGNRSQIPAYATSGTSGEPDAILPLIDWGFITTPQAGLNGRDVFYTQGKTLGGGSARNVMAYQRGTEGSYAQWADRVGDSSFNFLDLLPYFKKSPKFTPPLPQYWSNTGTEVKYDPGAYSSGGGPLQVSYSNYMQPVTPSFIKAFNALGLQQVTGLDSGSLLGYGFSAFSIDPKDQTRSSSETSFLRAGIAANELLNVYTHTSAKKILFDSNNTATGVVVTTQGGQPYQLTARKEVIVAAGVFKTPQLLMVSGIGPASTLQSLGIPCISALEGVGQNIWDHPYYSVGYKTNVTTDQALASPAYLYQANDDFVNNKSGPLTNIGGDVIGWEKVPAKYRANFTETTESDLAQFSSDWPEIELLPIAAATFPVTDTSNYFSVSVAGVAPVSRGNVTINSTDTNVQPVISPNWLTAEADQQVAVAGFKVARDLAAASGLSVGDEVFPGPSVQTDEQILEFIRETAYTIHHAIGTAKMGNATDEMAVVDAAGKVRGVNGLRIVDASVFPVLPPGHCQATVYAIAERFADLIKKGN